jgi:hypothetical protein
MAAQIDDPLAEARRLADDNHLFIKQVSRPVPGSYPLRYEPAWKLYRRPAYKGGRWPFLGSRSSPWALLVLVRRCAGID